MNNSFLFPAIVVAFLYGFSVQAQTCSATVTCGVGNTASCSAQYLPRFHSNEGECVRTSVTDLWKCRVDGICAEVSAGIKKCHEEIRKFTDNSLVGIVLDSDAYVCCRGNTAITTRELSVCR